MFLLLFHEAAAYSYSRGYNSFLAPRAKEIDLSEERCLAYRLLTSFGIKRITFGTQSLIESKEQWPFVLKIFINEPSEYQFAEETVAAYKIAWRKLGGLVADFSLFTLISEETGNAEIALIMRKVLLMDISFQIIEAMEKNDFSRAEEIIREQVAIIMEMIKRGVLLLDGKFENFGMIDGRQILLDPGLIDEKYTDSSVKKFIQILTRNYNWLTMNLKSERLGDFYKNLLEQNGLTESKIHETLEKNYGTAPPVMVPDIFDEVLESIGMKEKTHAEALSGSITIQESFGQAA